MSGSKFGKLLRNKEEDRATEAEEVLLEPEVQDVSPPQDAPLSKPPRGRPANGKRSNPEYERLTVYLPKDLMRRVKIRALERGDDSDFSTLLEEVLRESFDRLKD